MSLPLMMSQDVSMTYISLLKEQLIWTCQSVVKDSVQTRHTDVTVPTHPIPTLTIRTSTAKLSEADGSDPILRELSRLKFPDHYRYPFQSFPEKVSFGQVIP